MTFEVFQVVHEDFLFLDVLGYFQVVLGNFTLRKIDIGNLNISHVPFENKVSWCFLQLLKWVLHLSFRSEEDLHLRSFAQIPKLAKFQKELVQVVFSLLEEGGGHIAFSLFGWNWWDVQARVPIVQELSEDEELAISSEAVDFSETVVSFDQILVMLFHASAFALIALNLNLHDSIIGLDVVHLQYHGLSHFAWSWSIYLTLKCVPVRCILRVFIFFFYVNVLGLWLF